MMVTNNPIVNRAEVSLKCRDYWNLKYFGGLGHARTVVSHDVEPFDVWSHLLLHVAFKEDGQFS